MPLLAKELRDFIIDIVATKEGHLGASLGVVELTLALHYVFDTPDDRLIWDVGHQAYGHKILTGRKDIFGTNRQLGGISGFPKRAESEFDPFGTGHSSTSISAILGMAMAAKIQGNPKRNHIAVIGDASIASGMAFEGLNHMGVSGCNALVVLNDNSIGIDPSVGGLKEYLAQLPQTSQEQDNFFECLGMSYTGPVDGHDLPKLISELSRLKQTPGPKLLHVQTVKGKGLKRAEEEQVVYHAPGKFDKHTGDLLPRTGTPKGPKYQDVFGHTLVELARNNPNIVGITPAMPTGSSLKFMMDEIPDRAFDVGIAEQHAVTLAAGMAAEGLVPYCNIYSTFLQRAYDQVIHDVALQNLPVVFCLDRAGIVGQDGATHHGLFDIAYLRCIPNMILFSPLDELELRNILYTAQLGLPHPIAIRYPRGSGENLDWQQPFTEIPLGKAQCLQEGTQVAVLSFGPMGRHIQKMAAEMKNPQRLGHYNMRFAKPLDSSALTHIFETYETVVTLEDGCLSGGFGSAVQEFAQEQGYSLPIHRIGVPDRFVEHGRPEELYNEVGMDYDTITNQIERLLHD